MLSNLFAYYKLHTTQTYIYSLKITVPSSINFSKKNKMLMKKLRISTPFLQRLLLGRKEIVISSKTQFDFPSISPKVEKFPQFIQSRKLNFLRNDLGFSGRTLFSSEAAQKFSCWNCCNGVSSNTTPFLVCNACGCVQPVDQSVDYFQIFGL